MTARKGVKRSAKGATVPARNEIVFTLIKCSITNAIEVYNVHVHSESLQELIMGPILRQASCYSIQCHFQSQLTLQTHPP
jgi:hypothetical protein